MSHKYNKNPAAVDALSPEQYHVTQEKARWKLHLCCRDRDTIRVLPHGSTIT
jgi:hypothetical protein